MIEEFIERENRIFQILEKFTSKKLQYVLVGGYAVSAFSHRFSVDAELVIREEEYPTFLEILKKEGFTETERRVLETPYEGRFLSYKTREELPITVDLLVNSLECRQTEASWSYEYLKENSKVVMVEGSEKMIEARVPEKELLIAIKLHSGRLTDVRDVVALASDVRREKIKKHLERGDNKKLKRTLENVAERIRSQNFKDSFKGVFSEKEIPKKNLNIIEDVIGDVLSS